MSLGRLALSLGGAAILEHPGVYESEREQLLIIACTLLEMSMSALEPLEVLAQGSRLQY